MSDPKLNTPSSSEMQIDNLQSNDFSLLELFFKADAVVMLVMLSLIFLSIWCWAIIFNKYFKFKNEIKTRDNFEQYFSTSEIDHSALEKFIKEKIESNTFNSFEIIWILTEGGPRGATTTLIIDTYKQALGNYKFGRGAARAVVVMILLTLFAGFYLALLARINKKISHG